MGLDSQAPGLLTFSTHTNFLIFQLYLQVIDRLGLNSLGQFNPQEKVIE